MSGRGGSCVGEAGSSSAGLTCRSEKEKGVLLGTGNRSFIPSGLGGGKESDLSINKEIMREVLAIFFICFPSIDFQKVKQFSQIPNECGHQSFSFPHLDFCFLVT
ncbi:unnamed protein product [Bubo scandiacus]